MAFTETWSETTPAGASARSLGDDYIREFKRTYAERMAVDHDIRDDEAGAEKSVTPTGTIGYHKKVTMPVRSSAPSAVASACMMYTKDVSAVAEIFFQKEDGTEIQVTSGGALRSMPVGIIAVWAGTIATIPDGWKICDGNNSTPNLLGYFLQCVATAVTEPGTTGGAATHDHGAATGSHVLTTAEIPAHTHNINAGWTDSGGSLQYVDGNADANEGHLVTDANTGGGGGHTHTISSASSLPPKYEVAFIQWRG